ncbi:MAG: flagellar biosynthesis protein FliQ [Planctomycetota bacterium]|nr:flagellar biosynthesis protein FliQ [Planctomycetota bacterium]
MDPGVAIDLSTDALIQALILAGPVLCIGMIIGLMISVVQAVTQLQEQTLTFVPKIVAMGVTAALLLPWLTTRMVEYVQRLWGDSALLS